MSKSVGNVIDPFALADAYGVDPLRYFLLREVPFGQDGNYSHEAIVARVNADLANDLGNLAQRSLSMVARALGGVLPKPGTLQASDQTLLAAADALIGKARDAMMTQQLHQVLNAVWAVVAEANRYFAGEAPWALAKTDPQRQGTVLYVTAEVLRQVSILILPFMNAEIRKGDLRAVFTGGDAFGPYSVIFQVVTNEFLKKNPEAVKSFLADYVRGRHWFYDPANRRKAVEITAEFTKSPAEVLDSYFMTERDYYRDHNGCVGVATIQTPIDAMYNEGLIDRPVKVSERLNTLYLP